MAQTEYKLTNKFVDYSIAEQIAESGVEQALFYLKSNLETNSKMLEAMKMNWSQIFQYRFQLRMRFAIWPNHQELTIWN